MRHIFILLLIISSFIYGQEISDSQELDSIWSELVFKKGGCLTGGQYVTDGKFGNEGCVLDGGRFKEWNAFFDYPKGILSNFLIGQLSDTTTTNIHTCPCFNAFNSEVAVYCLQKIYLKNWYEFAVFEEYKEKERFGCFESDQSWLKEILQNNEKREALISAWKKE